ncbi:2-keto-4-pentenoate hydratase [Altererythrobacter lutimaris]|uniref:2-keto-4-pentenoate hydratase n=1 Tax=Altererythrobacter lutimaris TaxID=2743979 RepID=A0A850HBS5_9SPHN|nr:2-keto-4-pentenoate hydratase [Altererythrobacter lutimaris]NVE94461.1 2-keto-4-pentenoate hydratase [Altererythrobacter lutimaris]
MTDSTPIDLPSLSASGRAISEILREARKKARALPGFPGDVPDTLEEAYAIQDASRQAWPDTLIGWKVGGMSAGAAERFGTSRLAGPIFSRTLQNAKAGERTRMPAFEGGFAAIEPEFVLCLGDTRETDRLFIGCEIASSPVPDINGYGPAAVISDFGNNHGLLVGPEVTDWRKPADPVPVGIMINDELIGSRELDDITIDVMAAREFLLALCAERSIELPVGTLVSCGAITGVHEASIGASAHITFGSLGALDLELVPARQS